MATERAVEGLYNALRTAKPFDTVLWTAYIQDACENLGIISPKLKEFMPGKANVSTEHEPNVFAKGSSAVTAYAEQNAAFRKALTNLTLASMGQGLYEIKDDLGFHQAVIKDGVDKLNNESVLTVLPKVLQVYIESVIKEYNEELHKRQQAAGAEGRDPMDDTRDEPLKSLAELCQDAKFVEEFGKRLLSQTTNTELNTIDAKNMSDLKRNYRLCILFVHGYLEFKDTPPIVANSESNARLLPILQSWLEKTISRSEQRPFAAVIKDMMAAKAQGKSPQAVVKDWPAFSRDVGLIIQPLSGLYMPNANTNSTLWEVARTALETSYPGSSQVWDTTFVSTLPHEMATLTMTFKQNWYTEITRLRSALQKSQSNIVTVNEEWFRVNGVFPYLYKVTEKGSEIVDNLKSLNYLQSGAFSEPNAGKRTVNVLVKSMMKSEFYSQPSSFRNRQFQGPPPNRGKWDTGSYEVRQEQLKSGCFAPGTLIWTNYGERPIETLRENDEILTRADASGGQWGTKSDEVVANPVPGGSAVLYGFNDEPVFFTQNHVFRTTTGLRALDPLAAKRENPWLEVGELRPGHTLLHTKDGSTYEPVTIIKFNRRAVECDNVWGIHLREGLRSYHANGYLVHLNYPEITIKSIADTLKTLPSEQRTKMLGHIKELRPVFERFGGATVQQLLERELGDDELLQRLRHKTPEEFAPPPLYFQSRSYDITTKDQGPESYSVPYIDALDGVLYVDGEPCTRSTVFERGFSWSRQLSEELWEHGMCTFGADKKLISGDGLIWLEQDANPIKPTTSPIRFQASSISLRHAYLSMPPTQFHSLQATQVAELEHKLVIHQEVAEEEQAAPKDAFAELVADPNTDLHTLVGDATAYEANEKLAQKVEGRLPRQVESQPTTVDQTFEVKLDPEPFDPMSPTDNFETPIGSIVRKIVGQKEEANTYTYRIAELDELAKRRNQKLGTTSINYQTATDVYDSKNNWEVLITITDPIALALAADDNVRVVNDVEEPISWENLTFKNSGSSLVLPFVFNKIQFRVTATGFRGKLSRYEPDLDKATEEEGVRHLVQGTIVQAKPSAATTAEGSRSGAAPTNPGQPAPLTQNPEAARLIKSVTNLVTNLAAPSDKIKEDAQRYLYQAMIYHMDPKERDELAGANVPPVSSDPSRPETLPSELADGLDDDLKNWLKNTYSVAYLANNLSMQSKSQQEKFKAVFTEKDMKRLEYFYRGKGRNCLAQNPEYKRLNTMAAVSAFRRRVPKVVDYITDISKADVPTETEGEILRDAKGGVKWAYLYYHEITRADFIKQIAQSCSYVEHTNLNLLEYHTTVLNVLWGETPGSKMDGAKLGELLAGMVSREVSSQPLFRLALVDSAKSLESGLHDHFASLLDILLDPQKSAAAGIGTEMRKKLMDSLAAQADWQEKQQSAMAKEQKEAMIRGAAGAIKSVASTVSGVEQGVRGLPKYLQAIKTWVTGKKGLDAPVKPEVVGGPVSTKTKITAGLGFALTLAATTYYVMTSMESWGQWGDLDSLDRAKLVTGALQAAGGFVLSTYKSIQVYKGWDQLGKGSAEATHAAASELEKVVRPRANAMNPKLAKQASEIGTRPRSNAIVVREFGELGSKTKNTSEALLSAKKPTSWTKLKDKLSVGKSKLASKMKFNATETTMRSFAVAVSAVMLILSCVSLARNWDKLDDTERWLSVLGLIITLASLILEIIVLFACISPLWAIGVALAGIVVSILLGRHQAKKEPPKSPVQLFFENRAKPFLEKLDDPPPLTFDWTLEPASAKVGADTTVVVRGSPFKGDRSKLIKNLASVRITFHSGPNQSAALFSATSNFTEKAPDTALGQNQINIVYPKTLDKDFDVGAVESSIAGTNVRAWICKIELKDVGVLMERYKKDQLPYIDGLEEVRFEMRGFISKKGDQPKDAKEEEGEISPWAKYSFRIQEMYNDKDGNPSEMREKVLEFKKV